MIDEDASKGGLPEGFEGLERAGWRISVRSDLASAVATAAGGDPERLAAAGEARYEGRGRPVRVVLPDGTAGVLRRYRHGGLLRGLTGTLFAGRSRPLAELAATERARRAGVNVPEVLAAWHRPVLGFLHRGFLLTREVPGARDLVAVFGAGERAGAALRTLGAEVRRMHEAGVLHADLHVKNVLVDGGGRVTILDFDRARVAKSWPPAARIANLLRFDRSLVKLGRRGVAVARTDRLRFFAGYWPEGLPPGERADVVRRCRASLRRHRLGWRIFR